MRNLSGGSTPLFLVVITVVNVVFLGLGMYFLRDLRNSVRVIEQTSRVSARVTPTPAPSESPKEPKAPPVSSPKPATTSSKRLKPKPQAKPQVVKRKTVTQPVAVKQQKSWRPRRVIVKKTLLKKPRMCPCPGRGR